MPPKARKTPSCPRHRYKEFAKKFVRKTGTPSCGTSSKDMFLEYTGWLASLGPAALPRITVEAKVIQGIARYTGKSSGMGKAGYCQAEDTFYGYGFNQQGA